VFWSKIWFFLVALAAAAALAIMFVLPRPAQRDAEFATHSRLVLGCNVVDIKLADAARKRVGLVGTFARDKDIVDTLAAASAVDNLDDERIQKAHQLGGDRLKAINEDKPSFAWLIDVRGRIVARIGIDEGDARDVAAGRPLVDQALAGYLADDLWVLDKQKLYFVTASPVVKRSDLSYVGAVVLGYAAGQEFASRLVIPGAEKADTTDVGFFLGADALGLSQAVTFETGPLVDAVKARGSEKRELDCAHGTPVAIKAGNDSYQALAARLPGEAGGRGAYFAVFTTASEATGTIGTIKRVEKGDLSFGNFPWLLVVGGFVVALGIGLALMIVETDRPLRRLVADTVKLAKGEAERLAEDAHKGKFGSIARSVNIHIDKLGREAKSAKKDLDQLLGPAPEGSLGTIDLLATALPASRPGGPAPAVAPPPAEFRFDGGQPMMPPPQMMAPQPMMMAPQPMMMAPQPMAAPQMMAPPPQMHTPPPMMVHPPTQPPQRVATRPATPPPAVPAGTTTPPPFPRAPTPPPFLAQSPVTPPQPMAVPSSAPVATSAPMRLDDDILGASGPAPAPRGEPITAVGGDNAYFAQVYEQFLAVKRSCNEPTTGLTFQKFSDKLVKNRDDLIAKTGCREVRFTVYVKDGKAALKATPVKDG
jgi:hypothetical protein